MHIFYYAFFSDQRLKIDFSLEQMFPENDPEKEVYDDFRNRFPREDDIVLLIYVPPVHPLNVESLRVTDSVVEDISSIQSKSNCISVKDFPCKNIQYNDSTNWLKAGKAYFFDYKNDSIFFRISHYFDNPEKHMIKIKNLPDIKIDNIFY